MEPNAKRQRSLWVVVPTCLLVASVLYALGAIPGGPIAMETPWYGRNLPGFVLLGLILPFVAALLVWFYVYQREVKSLRIPLRSMFFLVLALAFATKIALWIYPYLIGRPPSF